MKRFARALLVAVVVFTAAGVGFVLVARLARGGRSPEDATVPATAASNGQSTAPANAAPAAPLTAGAPPDIRTQPVTIYLRAQTQELALAPVTTQIVWFNAPVDRARQVVQLVFEGVPGTAKAVPPASVGVRYRDVLIAQDGTAWVDLEGGSLGSLAGTDEEQALIGALARSLSSALPDDVKRVGITVDGKPAETLAGHVDLRRTYTGREWPATSDAEAAPSETEGAASAEGDATRG